MNSKTAIGIGIIILAIIAAALYFNPAKAPTTSTTTNTVTERPLNTFYNGAYGIAFNYPDNYAVQEHDSTEGAKHHTIVVGDKAALANVPQNGEGPPTISIDIYNNPSKQTTQKWITANDFSNYKLSQKSPLATTTVAGIPALAYPWDGLYPSTSIVFPEKGKIYMVSVSYNSPSDQIVKDFAKVVASIQFDP